MIAETRAIVLNTHNFGDTSLICNLFSEDYGKFSVISKGAKSIKNPNHAILQPMNYIEICYYYKNKRNIQFLKEASINNHFYMIKKNYEKLLYGYNIIDIINKTSQTEDSCHIVFRLAHKVLKKINHSKQDDLLLYFIFFNLQLLRYLGYEPLISKCFNCNKHAQLLFYNYYIGQLVCSNCKANDLDLTLDNNSLNIMKFLMITHIDDIKQKFSFEKKFNNIKIFLHDYISYHIIDDKQIKSYKFLS